ISVVCGHDPFGGLQPPRVLDELGELRAVDLVEVDEHDRIAVVVPRREVRARLALEQRLAVGQVDDAHHERIRVRAQAAHELASDLQRRRAVGRADLDPRKVLGGSEHVIPAGHRREPYAAPAAASAAEEIATCRERAVRVSTDAGARLSEARGVVAVYRIALFGEPFDRLIEDPEQAGLPTEVQSAALYSDFELHVLWPQDGALRLIVEGDGDVEQFVGLVSDYLAGGGWEAEVTRVWSAESTPYGLEAGQQ